MAHGWRYAKLGRWWAGIMPVLLVVLGCRSTPLAPPRPQAAVLSPAAPPTLLDDLDRASLHAALHRSLEYIRQLPPERSLPCGAQRFSAATLQHTLEAFQQLLAKPLTPTALSAALAEQFELIQTTGQDGQGTVLFTGYYEISLEGSRGRTPEFSYPLYTPPLDLVDIDLGLFQSRYAGERLVARYAPGKALPYFTRREIDLEGKLQGRGLELVWLRDPVEAFFLHVQGSGRIRLPDGQTMYVQYAASNGHPYQSIGRVLLEEGRLSRSEVSLQGLRRYLQAHPEERARVLSTNPRYIFFHQVEQGPRGSLNVVLVPGRSIATDTRLFPPAGLAFIQTQKPVFNAQGEITAWQPFSRFVFNHDTGSAITGPGRVDLFWGSDATAEMAAGHMQHAGKLFFLVARQPRSTSLGASN
jgi:peptidoglycan lytic transglycosylase A